MEYRYKQQQEINNLSLKNKKVNNEFLVTAGEPIVICVDENRSFIYCYGNPLYNLFDNFIDFYIVK